MREKGARVWTMGPMGPGEVDAKTKDQEIAKVEEPEVLTLARSCMQWLLASLNQDEGSIHAYRSLSFIVSLAETPDQNGRFLSMVHRQECLNFGSARLDVVSTSPQSHGDFIPTSSQHYLSISTASFHHRLIFFVLKSLVLMMFWRLAFGVIGAFVKLIELLGDMCNVMPEFPRFHFQNV